MEISYRGYLVPDAIRPSNHACVIPCGALLGDSTMYWSRDQLQPYTKYVVNGSLVDDMFESFIFNGVRVREDRFIYPLFMGFGDPSDITDWLMWADGLFLPDFNLNALAQVSGEKRRNVWVSIPYPHPFQRSFGFVGLRNLDFQLEEDRIAAVEWWLDQFLSRWWANTQLHTQLNLRGFLWPREAIDENDESVVIKINEIIRLKGYSSMWLPNYGSYGVITWRDWGFDVASVFPNYTGNTGYESGWIQSACLFAAAYHTGLQIAWGNGLLYNDIHHVDYWNLGLDEKFGYMRNAYLIHHFPNQRLDKLQQNSFVDYARLYTFIKGLYQRVEYPGIAY